MCENLETNFEKLRQVARMPSYWGYCVIIYFLLWPVAGTDLQSPRDWAVQGAMTLVVTLFYVCSHYVFVTLAGNFQASKAYVIYPAGWGVVAALGGCDGVPRCGDALHDPHGHRTRQRGALDQCGVFNAERVCVRMVLSPLCLWQHRHRNTAVAIW